MPSTFIIIIFLLLTIYDVCYFRVCVTEMAFWSVVLAVALLTTRAWSTQDDLGTNDTDGDPRGGLSFILPAPYKVRSAENSL